MIESMSDHGVCFREDYWIGHEAGLVMECK